ncbi:MAG: lipopolysaccharide biosynthesis protein [Candidatus Heimdallarchaeota archaeon]|nr:lipopolysaccharide biosynthesis protein [Candidatus Heimdallarchaeota archaeon]
MVDIEVETDSNALISQGSGTYFVFVFFITYVISKLLNLAFKKIFTNVLTLEEMGQYGIFLTASITIITYATLGLPTALSRFAVTYVNNSNKEKLKNMVFSGFVLFLVFEIIIVGILLTLYYTIDYHPWFLNIQDQYIFILLMVIGIVFAQVISTICYTLASALQNGRHYAIPIIMRALLQIPLSILFVVYFKLGVKGLVIGLFLSELIVALYSLFIIMKDLGIGKFSLEEIKAIFKYSFPGYIAGILLTSFNLFIVAYVDYIFIENAEGKGIISLYQNGALNIVNFLLIIGTAFKVVYPPILYKNFEKKNFEEINYITTNVSKLFTIIVIGASIFLFAFSPILINLLTQNIYLPSIPLIPLLLIASALELMHPIMTFGYAFYMKTYWQIVAALISIPLATIAGFFIIPLNGLLGIGIAYLVFRVLFFVTLFIVSQHYYKINYDLFMYLRLFLATILAVGIGIIFYYYVFNPDYGLNLLASFSISGVLYAFFLVSFRLIKRADFDFVKNLGQTFLQIWKSRLAK